MKIFQRTEDSVIVARNDTSTIARCNVDNGRAKYRSMVLYLVKEISQSIILSFGPRTLHFKKI